MSSIGGISDAAVSSGAARETASPELAQLEKKLADCVNCPPSETTAGQAEIAEITNQIEAIKAQANKAAVSKTDDANTSAATRPCIQGPSPVASSAFRFDGLGTYLNATA